MASIICCLSMLALGTTATANDSLSFTAQESVVYPISGNLPDLSFKLLSRNNQVVTEKDVAGKVAVVFFGYANCPDICPLTLAQLNLVLKKLGPDASKQVQIIFISVDPLRDTPDNVQTYVDAFKNGAIGLSGSPKDIQSIAKRYRVSYQVDRPKDASQDTDYEVMHARGIYIFDQKGKARFLASDADQPDALIKALKTLIQ
ncbi:electron transporter [Basilea psittacipulmonis DSM 24701]|uniref:Electron transporter n=1 Tax=Basilea psittacipulmonis DSM 24701 TaxID=1072685 RepID=A0A077DGD8_9BURK|nr:electron transporter [Basilea psittacipulmonis DSM 24701]